MAELSDFLPKTGPFYVTDIFDASVSVTSTTTTSTGTNVANLSGKGSVGIEASDPTTQLTIRVDNTTTLTGTYIEFCRLLNASQDTGFSIAFESSYQLDITTLPSGFVIITTAL